MRFHALYISLREKFRTFAGGVSFNSPHPVKVGFPLLRLWTSWGLLEESLPHLILKASSTPPFALSPVFLDRFAPVSHVFWIVFFPYVPGRTGTLWQEFRVAFTGNGCGLACPSLEDRA